jgi:hypothetical protein
MGGTRVIPGKKMQSLAQILSLRIEWWKNNNSYFLGVVVLAKILFPHNKNLIPNV